MIRDVQVHLDGTSGDEIRIRHAETLATLFGAHLTGLFTNHLPDLALLMPVDGGAAAAQVFADADAAVRATGDRIEDALRDRFQRLSVANEVRRLESIPGEVVRRAATESRWADVFVAGRPYDGEEAGRWGDVFEAVLFQGGRAVYVVPPASAPPSNFRRVLVAWNDSREAARALAEAAPFIQNATRTKLLLVDPGSGTTSNSGEPSADIARHIGRLGTEVEVEEARSGDLPISNIILDQAKRLAADLVVMGAYGRSRTREWVLGGTTREMLESSNFPILMAH